jgi:hypothetical protein
MRVYVFVNERIEKIKSISQLLYTSMTCKIKAIAGAEPKYCGIGNRNTAESGTEILRD